MGDFKAKMHKITALPQTPWLYLREPTSKGREGKRERRGRGKKGGGKWKERGWEGGRGRERRGGVSPPNILA